MLVTLGFFEKGADEFVEEQEPSHVTEGMCGQDSVGYLVKLERIFCWECCAVF